jgi:hypothetical protein
MRYEVSLRGKYSETAFSKTIIHAAADRDKRNVSIGAIKNFYVDGAPRQSPNGRPGADDTLQKLCQRSSIVCELAGGPA